MIKYIAYIIKMEDYSSVVLSTETMLQSIKG